MQLLLECGIAGWTNARTTYCGGHTKACVVELDAGQCDTHGVLPSPLVGRGWGWGWQLADAACAITTTPLPSPPPQGGREQTAYAALTSFNGTRFSFGMRPARFTSCLARTVPRSRPALARSPPHAARRNGSETA